jgi:hypothetical protein
VNECVRRYMYPWLVVPSKFGLPPLKCCRYMPIQAARCRPLPKAFASSMLATNALAVLGQARDGGESATGPIVLMPALDLGFIPSTGRYSSRRCSVQI